MARIPGYLRQYEAVADLAVPAAARRIQTRGMPAGGNEFDWFSTGAFAAASKGILPGIASPFPADIDLATLDGIIGFRIDGENAGNSSGADVSSAGDVNGDGFDDIIIGAPYFANGLFTNAGRAYVVFGSAGGFADIELGDLDGTDGFFLTGINSSDRFGSSVAAAGDVNGDGIDDLIVGAWLADGQQTDSGAAYVVFGRTDGFEQEISLLLLDGSDGFRVSGETSGSYFGWSVAGAGDVDGDGIDDIIIGAPQSAAYDGGTAYVIFGTASGFADTVIVSGLDGSQGFAISIGLVDEDVGRSVKSAGDVNGDGIGDIIVGSRLGNGDTGQGFVVFGRSGGFDAEIDPTSLDGTDGFRLNGLASGDRAGISVSSAGDINGDGYDDIIIGAYLADPGGESSAGESYVVFGKASGFAADIDLGALNGSDGFRIPGIDISDQSGRTVRGDIDVNGDGFDDIVIGARNAGAGGPGQGYVIFGRSSGFNATFDLAALTGVTGFAMTGEFGGDLAGHGIAGAGDFNGDGIGDLVIGAPDALAEAGRSYVVFGRLPDTAVNWTGGDADQSMTGGGFDDTIAGVGGNDTLTGNGGRDSLSGGNGADLLLGGIGVDTLRGSNGADTLRGGNGADLMTGAAHADSLQGSLGSDTATGGDGSDTIAGGAGGDSLDGGNGIDTLSYAESSAAVIIDLVVGFTEGGDAVGDTIAGFENLIGSDFADILVGDANSNSIAGGEGNDSIVAQDGADTLAGDAGNDTLFGGLDAAADSFDGGSGIDWVDYTDSKVRADLQVPSSNTGDATGDTYTGIENLRGSALRDTLRGDGGNNRLEGMDVNDVLTGRGGDDTLVGGLGADELTGDGGADDFVIGEIAEAENIVDFEVGIDELVLVGAVFGLALGAISPDIFVLGNAALDADDRLTFRSATGKLYFDPDGNGAAPQELIAIFDNLAVLSADDFLVI